MIIKDEELEIRTINENEIDSVLGVYKECEDFLELGPEFKNIFLHIKKCLVL